MKEEKKKVQREGKRERETEHECVYFKVNIQIYRIQKKSTEKGKIIKK